MTQYELKRITFGYALVAPAFILMLLFFVWPFLSGILISFRSGLGVEFVGFENYVRTLQDPRFWNSLKVSLIFTVAFILLSAGGGLIFAIAALNRKRGSQTYLAIAFIPYISTPVIGALIWLNFLGFPFGLINQFLLEVGLRRVAWLQVPSLALSAIIVIQVWYTLGYNAILYLAGLQSIPNSYYESAELEGCGFVRKLVHITLPLIIPTTVFVITISTMYGFINSFVLARLITGGGPFEATNVLMAYIIELGFDRMDLGRANAVTNIAFVGFLLVAYSQFSYQRRNFQGLQ